MLKKLSHSLYAQVLLAITAGVVLGHCAPDAAIQMQPLGEGFIRLIKLTIGPVVFCTVVSGLAGLQNMKKVGRVSGKALLYFESVSTLALVIGLLAAHWLQPGAGFNVDPASLDARAIALTQPTQPMGGWLAHLIPDTFVGAFASGNMLHVLLIAALFGVALAALGEQVRGVALGIDKLSQVFFKLVRLITKAAPIGAFGAMAFSIGQYGLASLVPQLKLIGAFCFVSALFILTVFGAIAYAVGFNLLRFLAYLKEELLIVLSTSSSEAALPRLMQKLEQLGCARSVVGLVVPAGYTCNLDGTNLYLTMAVLFIAQATNTALTLTQQLTLLAVAMLTSKGASGVAGAGFITLAATLAVVPTVPLSGMVLILGIDRFMSDIRALTNLIGNGVAAIVICAWEKEFDYARMKQVIGLSGVKMKKIKLIDPKRLFYFGEVFKRGSINAAADRLNRVQAGIGRQIRLLEQELGVRLFERGTNGRGMVTGGRGRGMVPTDAAQFVYDFYCQYRDQQDKLERVLQDMQGMKRGDIHIAAPAAYVDALMDEVINDFCRQHPALTITFKEASNTPEITSQVLHDEVHIGVIHGCLNEPNISYRARTPLPVCLLVNQHHPLASKQRGTLSEIADYPLALPPSNSHIATAVKSIACSEGVQLTPALISDSITARKKAAMTGRCGTLMSTFAARQEIQAGQLCVCEIDHPLTASMEAGLIVRRGRLLSPAANQLLRLIASKFSLFHLPPPSLPHITALP